MHSHIQSRQMLKIKPGALCVLGRNSTNRASSPVLEISFQWIGVTEKRQLLVPRIA